jgi:hypothetical protein
VHRGGPLNVNITLRNQIERELRGNPTCVSNADIFSTTTQPHTAY